jgi:AmmeMemoRadiSam system protein B
LPVYRWQFTVWPVYQSPVDQFANEMSIRPPAVAGLFYPDDPAELRDVVSDYLTRASVKDLPARAQAFIVPHAGYVYSGSTAAVAYSLAAAERARIRKVVLIGPSHRAYLEGLAVPEAAAFATPLGDIPIDVELKRALEGHPNVIESDQPHRMEHSLEVQLPFLQLALGEFTLLPLVAGAASAKQVASVLERVWEKDNGDTLILASSDLSHYHTYSQARLIDAATNDAILNRQSNLTGDQACGAVAINGLLETARVRNLQVEQLALCNSGDTAGDRSRVVGYGAYALYDDRQH